jgi:DNA repair protein RadC
MERYRYRVMMVRDGEALPPLTVLTPRESLVAIVDALAGCDVLGREYFGALYLSARHQVLGSEIISMGCLTESLVHPREVFRGAVVRPCASMILFHNHPSGDPEPSSEDVALTKRLAAAGALLGIEVLDHVIVAKCEPEDWRMVSMRDRGVL